MNIALQQISDKNSPTYAIAIDLLGLLQLDTNHPVEAVDSFLSGLRIRQNLLSPSDDFIASSLNHVSLAFTELREWEQAATYQQEAMDIRLANKSPRIGNSYSNMSSILLGMGKPDEAEKMLMKCPSLKNMSDESFLRTDNPRFSRYHPLLQP
jgi:tetratricopeptide (TPR) repeat protein